MHRCTTLPRSNWQSIVENQGLSFHTENGDLYWDENVFYDFSSSQIEVLEKATDEVHQMCLHVVQYVIENSKNTFPKFGIPPEFYDFVKTSWEEDDHAIYGRIDFVYDGVDPPKLLEYNADTPTTLLESSIIQHQWLKDVGGNFKQFNCIHERLIEAFKRIKKDCEIDSPFYLTSLNKESSLEDYTTVKYLLETATLAGLETVYIDIEDIGYCDEIKYFLDSNTNDKIEHVFKLYPWEWLFIEEFGQYLLNTETKWYEPAWKCILSNKAILPYLWDIFGDSHYILKSSFDQSIFTEGNYVRKPILSREGQNILIVKNNQVLVETSGEYTDSPVIYQEYAALPVFAGGNRPIIGSWLVNGYPAGIGIRESSGLVTNNFSRFVPHRFIPSPTKTKIGFDELQKRYIHETEWA